MPHEHPSEGAGRLLGFAHKVLARRVWVIAPCLLAVALLGAGMARLAFKNDYRMFFTQDNPELAAFEALQKTFSRNDNVLISVTAQGGRSLHAAHAGRAGDADCTSVAAAVRPARRFDRELSALPRRGR